MSNDKDIPKIKIDPNRSVLKDHKKEGKKLIPPMMQLPNMKPVSFRENTLPCLIWISGFFGKSHDREAVQKPIEFLIQCNDVLDSESSPPLVFLNNFNKLSEQQKKSLCENPEIKEMLPFLWENICHQSYLFSDYPLSFLFAGFEFELTRGEAIERLKQDVVGLLDRHCDHATKVQVTTMVSMMATKKLIMSSNINLPDLNAIFTAPDSDDAKRAASFARANLNAGMGYGDEEGGENDWSKSFWRQTFKLEGCQ